MRATAAELSLEDPLARLDLRQRFGVTTEAREEPHDRRVRHVLERIDRHTLACIGESILRRHGESFHECVEHAQPERADALSFGTEPLVEAVAIRKVQAFEEVAREQLGRRAKTGGLRRERARSRLRCRLEKIHVHSVRFEPDALPVSDEPLLVAVVDEWPELGQTPAECGPRVVGTIPEEIT
jgi:hypothetical protein